MGRSTYLNVVNQNNDAALYRIKSVGFGFWNCEHEVSSHEGIVISFVTDYDLVVSFIDVKWIGDEDQRATATFGILVVIRFCPIVLATTCH